MFTFVLIYRNKDAGACTQLSLHGPPPPPFPPRWMSAAAANKKKKRNIEGLNTCLLSPDSLSLSLLPHYRPALFFLFLKQQRRWAPTREREREEKMRWRENKNTNYKIGGKNRQEKKRNPHAQKKYNEENRQEYLTQSTSLSLPPSLYTCVEVQVDHISPLPGGAATTNTSDKNQTVTAVIGEEDQQVNNEVSGCILSYHSTYCKIDR